jgi:hypothetical protein
MKAKYINTTWQTATYDVWGNEKDGYEVNDVYRGREIELRIPVTVNNPGTPQQFESAYPTDRQIREALDCKPRIRLTLDGDDLTIYADHESSGYPLGELHCVSHESLSPVREVK